MDSFGALRRPRAVGKVFSDENTGFMLLPLGHRSCLDEVLSPKLLLNLNKFVEENPSLGRLFYELNFKIRKFSICSCALQRHSENIPRSFASYVQSKKKNDS